MMVVVGGGGIRKRMRIGVAGYPPFPFAKIHFTVEFFTVCHYLIGFRVKNFFLTTVEETQ